MNSLNDEAVIIIRTAGERMEQVCRELILEQGIAPSNVITLREAPFSAAVRRSFEIGIEHKLPWTLCVDADLLLRPGAIETMLRLAKWQKENICEIQGYVLDKFYGGPRTGGAHVYRTSLLPFNRLNNIGLAYEAEVVDINNDVLPEILIYNRENLWVYALQLTNFPLQH